MKNTSTNAGSAKEVKYGLITGENLTAKSAKEVKYALITGENLPAKSAKEVKYALITGKSKPAKSAEEVKYAPITGESKPAKSAEEVKYALITGKNLAVMTATKVISCFLPIDDTEELCYDLQNDELVKRELSNIAGLLVVRGGRLVALGSALFQVARHIKFNRDSEADNGEAAVENRNLRETEGSDANKIEAGPK